jgi:hypothetical protein
LLAVAAVAVAGTEGAVLAEALADIDLLLLAKTPEEGLVPSLNTLLPLVLKSQYMLVRAAGLIKTATLPK